MRFGILGSLEVRLPDGSPVVVDGSRRRALLTLLALEAGRFVSVERLIDGIYGENPPAGARNAVQAQVSRLRQSLGTTAPVEFDASGYRLVVEPEAVDVHQFHHLARRGRVALQDGDHAEAAALLRQGLDLWRGPTLGELADHAVIARLAEDRVAATEDRIDAELALGQHRALVAELRELVAEQPFRERLCGQLMRALHFDGRQTEALEVFAELRRALVAEFGTEPSAALSATHLAVLRGTPERQNAALRRAAHHFRRPGRGGGGAVRAARRPPAGERDRAGRSGEDAGRHRGGGAAGRRHVLR